MNKTTSKVVHSNSDALQIVVAHISICLVMSPNSIALIKLIDDMASLI